VNFNVCKKQEHYLDNPSLVVYLVMSVITLSSLTQVDRWFLVGSSFSASNSHCSIAFTGSGKMNINNGGRLLASWGGTDRCLEGVHFYGNKPQHTFHWPFSLHLIVHWKKQIYLRFLSLISWGLFLFYENTQRNEIQINRLNDTYITLSQLD